MKDLLNQVLIRAAVAAFEAAVSAVIELSSGQQAPKPRKLGKKNRIIVQ